MGAPGTIAQSFLGVCILIVAVLAGFMTAGQATAARTEEAGGRTDNIAIEPVSRTAWLGGRVVIAVAVLVLAGLLAGVFAWLGVEAEGGGVSFATLLDAGLNVVPAAICLLGIGILAMGAWPRKTSYVVHGYLGWSLLIEMVGGFGSGSRWLRSASLYHQMASAPAVDPNRAVNGVMIGIGAVAALSGVASFRRRDLDSAQQASSRVLSCPTGQETCPFGYSFTCRIANVRTSSILGLSRLRTGDSR